MREGLGKTWIRDRKKLIENPVFYKKYYKISELTRRELVNTRVSLSLTIRLGVDI